MFYILNKDGNPLMPTTRYRHMKNLMKEGKAIKISSNPFTVKLLYDAENATQNLLLGIDPGRTNIGLAVVKEDGTVVFQAELETRNKQVPKLMTSRKQFRRERRSERRRKKRIRKAIAAGTTTTKCCEKHKMVGSKPVGIIQRNLPGCDKPLLCNGIKNKEARFNNRKRPPGWLTPTANQLKETHINVVRKLQKILPITSIVLEVNRFAFVELDNPNIQRWQYAKGPLYGKGSVRNAIYEMQNGRCILCDAPIAQYHHIVPRSNGGSDTISNVVGLCFKCHSLVHKEKAFLDKLQRIKSGQNKKYGALSVLNQVIPALVKAYSEMLPTMVTDGTSTYLFREHYKLEKTHCTDAYCIACSVLDNPSIRNDAQVYRMKQFRRHDRQARNQEKVTRRYMLDGKVVAENRHKAMEQFSDSLEEYVANGGRTDKLQVKPHPAVYKHMDRILPGALLSVEGIPKVMVASTGRQPNGLPGYYCFSDGTKATPKHCNLLRRNEGIVFA